MNRPIATLALLCASSSLALYACTTDDSPALVAPDALSDAAVEADRPDTSVATDSGDEASAAITTATLASFDPTKGELPEAISFRDGAAYVSLVATGQIAKITYPSSARSLYAQLPVQPSNYTLGSAFDAAGNLFVAVAATNPADPLGMAAAGVYRVAALPDGGTTVSLWASSDAGFKFPNGLSFDAAGSLYVTDAAEGAVYKLPSAGALGTATPWKMDPALRGDLDACPAQVRPFAVGANGIVAEASAIWVANTDNGTLLKIAVDASGAAGALTTVVQDCAKLEGIDGMHLDPRDPDAFVAANNTAPSIVSIRRTGQITTLLSGKPPFHSPADLVHVPGTANPTVMLVVNASFDEALAPPDAGLLPVPSLMQVTLP
jgi:hypothetical protein